VSGSATTPEARCPEGLVHDTSQGETGACGHSTLRAGGGSTFSLTIPTGDLKDVTILRRPAEVIRDRTMDAAPATGEDLAGIRILLAEDGLDNQRLITTLLRKAGADVEVVDNGCDAVEQAEAEPFDVVLMDMQMRKMDGCEATRTLRQGGYRAAILALTANAMAHDRQRCLAAGCDDHLTKPISRAMLIRTVAVYSGGSAPDVSDDGGAAVRLSAGGGDSIRSDYGDDADLTEVIDEFVGGLPDQAARMRDALQHNDFDGLRGLAHQLKGAGGSYGYGCLTEAARALEIAAKAADAEGADLALGTLAELCSAVIRGRHKADPCERAERYR